MMWTVRSKIWWCALAIFACVPRAGAEDFWEPFDGQADYREVGTMEESENPDWWLSAGGRFHEGIGIAASIQGDLPESDPYRRGYAAVNPTDTDDGYHPQNIFRLIGRRKWRNFHHAVYARVRRANLSDSPNRNRSNGVFLMSRYRDAENVYYAGLRVDGKAVIKRKRHGAYATLAKTRVFGDEDYHRVDRPFFLPLDRWLGIDVSIRNADDGSVVIVLSIDAGDGQGWRPILEAVDPSADRIPRAGYTGIRTDFMDVECTQYSASGD